MKASFKSSIFYFLFILHVCIKNNNDNNKQLCFLNYIPWQKEKNTWGFFFSLWRASEKPHRWRGMYGWLSGLIWLVLVTTPVATAPVQSWVSAFTPAPSSPDTSSMLTHWLFPTASVSLHPNKQFTSILPSSQPWVGPYRRWEKWFHSRKGTGCTNEPPLDA